MDLPYWKESCFPKFLGDANSRYRSRRDFFPGKNFEMGTIKMNVSLNALSIVFTD